MTVEIQLTRGVVAIVDDVDADLAALNWCATSTKRYALRRVSDPVSKTVRTGRLHRVIMARILGRELTKAEQVDHKNRSGLCNTRANLRLATPAENAANTGRMSNNTSGFKGVSFFRRRQKWRAYIRLPRGRLDLGCFDDIHQAAIAYDQAALKNFGEFAATNFPKAAYGSGDWPPTVATPDQPVQSPKRLTRTNNTSGYRGVCLHKRMRKWSASLTIGSKRIHLGGFDNILDAVVAHDRAAYLAFGEFVRANNPHFACGLEDTDAHQ